MDRLDALNQRGAGVFLAVNEIDGSARLAKNVSRIRAVFGEFDDGLPETFPVEPTFLVESSPGRFHAYWVADGLTGDDFDGVMSRLVADYRSDKNAKDRSRLLRLAGTWNMKDPANPWLVRIAAASGTTYTRERIIAAFPPIERRRPTTDKQVEALKNSANVVAVDAARIKDALSAIPADLDYATWLSIGQALHHHFHGDVSGLEIFDAWSRGAPAVYNADGPNSPANKWQTFGGDYTGEPVTIATVFHNAQQHGWKSFEERMSETAARLAVLHPVLYDQERKEAAKALGCKTATLDALVKAKRDELEPEGATALAFAPIEPWEDDVDGAELLDELTATLERYVVLPDQAAETIALWIVLAHAHDAALISPILAYQSPTKQCGKTTVMNLTGELVPKPLPASSATPSVLFRAIEKYRPTLLLDEADTFLDANPELAGVINSGHNRRSASVLRNVGDDHEPQVFSTWAPKAIAAIRKFPDTVQDRSIVITLRRKTAGEKVERLRLDKVEALDTLRRKTARWANDNMGALRNADPNVPDDLGARAADNWRLMIAIADLAGGDWPKKARSAATELSGGSGDEPDTTAIELLRDIRHVFNLRYGNSFGTLDIGVQKLVDALNGLEESPWVTFNKGGPITANTVKRLLGYYKIKSAKKASGKVYVKADFEDAWQRYLPEEKPSPPDTPGKGAGVHSGNIIQ